IRKTLDVTTAEFQEHTARKKPVDLERAIGLVRKKLLDHPNIEQKLGSINIRMEFLVFLLSMGLRTGETITLPLKALQRCGSTEILTLNIWSEKSDSPRQSPVP